MKIAPKLLWPWWRCSLFGLFLSTLWLAWGALTCSGHSSSRRPAGLIKARAWLSPAMRFARGAAHGRRAAGMTQPRWRLLFSAAALAFPYAHWRGSAESLTFNCLAATLRRNILISSRRPPGLIKARTLLSPAMRFARGDARGRRTVGVTQPRWRSLFSAAALAFPCAHWRRSAEALTFKRLAAILRRNILITTRRTRTFAQPARWWSTMFR